MVKFELSSVPFSPPSVEIPEGACAENGWDVCHDAACGVDKLAVVWRGDEDPEGGKERTGSFGEEGASMSPGAAESSNPRPSPPALSHWERSAVGV